MRTRTRILTPPAAPLISLSDAKQHCRVDGDYDDAYLVSLIESASAYLVDVSGRSFVIQTVEAVIDAPIFWPLDLPLGPVKTVQSVEVESGAGAWLEIDDGAWVFDHTLDLIAPPPCASRVRVRYTAGYGDQADVPGNVRHLARILVGHWYQNREAVSDVASIEVPMAFDMLLSAVRDYRGICG